ncbi:putative U-box domain-containing protein 44-like isoform X1 [Capsicum annuum]|nr:putative U-box domain-containing protein 44-like isoform X1 [Capsicum annuum]
MYAKMGLLPSVRKLFDEMEMKDVPTWNSLIAGYAKNGNVEEAFKLFFENAFEESVYKEMEKARGVKPNEVKIASVLPACANLGALEVGEKIEVYARASGCFKNMFVCNAVLEIYTRSMGSTPLGSMLQGSHLWIQDLVVLGEQIRVWMIAWSAREATFDDVIHGSIEPRRVWKITWGEGNAPDDVTFVGAILACTHGGLVEKGWELLKSDGEKILHSSKLEHYGCMADLLGRAGRLQEAYDLIQSMPMRPDNGIWGTLLGACSFHGNVELAEQVEFLFVLEPWNPGNYVILSNIYARAGLRDGVARFRKLMKSSQITNAAGYSFIEEGGDIHKFVVEDKSHPKSNEIYALLKSPLD